MIKDQKALVKEEFGETNAEACRESDAEESTARR